MKISSTQIRENLFQLGQRITYILENEILIKDDPYCWYPNNDPYQEIKEEYSIRSFEDIVRLNRFWIEEQLRIKLGPVSPELHTHPQYRAMIGLLTACKIAETVDSPGPPKQWWNQMAADVKTKFGNDLEGFLLAKDIRRCLLILVPELTGINGLTFMSNLRLRFPRSGSEVDPSWVRQYQKPWHYTQSWAYQTISGLGRFLVLYTKRCQFLKCRGCALPQLGNMEIVSGKDINKQIDQAMIEGLMDFEKQETTELVLSNNGSVFDTATIPTSSLLYFISTALGVFPNLKKLSFESRIEYLEPEVFRLIRETISFERRNIELEVAIGVEVFDEEFRNQQFRKDLDFISLEKIAESLPAYGASIRFYMMYKPLPEMDIVKADSDILEALKYFESLSEQFGVSIIMHLNPTYVAKNTYLEKAFLRGEYTPPDLGNLSFLLSQIRDSSVKIYVGLNDEGLAVDGGSFLKPETEKFRRKLLEFNYTQDFSQLVQ